MAPAGRPIRTALSMMRRFVPPSTTPPGKGLALGLSAADTVERAVERHTAGVERALSF